MKKIMSQSYMEKHATGFMDMLSRGYEKALNVTKHPLFKGTFKGTSADNLLNVSTELTEHMGVTDKEYRMLDQASIEIANSIKKIQAQPRCDHMPEIVVDLLNEMHNNYPNLDSLFMSNRRAWRRAMDDLFGYQWSAWTRQIHNYLNKHSNSLGAVDNKVRENTDRCMRMVQQAAYDLYERMQVARGGMVPPNADICP
jgi:hypothetical protein